MTADLASFSKELDRREFSKLLHCSVVSLEATHLDGAMRQDMNSTAKQPRLYTGIKRAPRG